MSPLRKTVAVPEFFRAFARRISDFVGSSWAFAGAVLTIVVWAAAGPVYHYSDTWQLVINTGTTVVTFLMVFLMQNTQNRDAKAIHLKLDELLRGETPRRDPVELGALASFGRAKALGAGGSHG